MGEEGGVRPPTHVHLRNVAWGNTPSYPEALRKVYRYKALVGGRWAGVIPHSDVFMGILELAPGAIYPAHHHPAPEIYFVVRGAAQWTVGDDTFLAEPGTAIYHRPGTLHRMINTGDDVLGLVYFWWAPNGDREVLKVESRLLEPLPEQPTQAKFPE